MLNDNSKKSLKQYSSNNNNISFLEIYFFFLYKVANYIANFITKNFAILTVRESDLLTSRYKYCYYNSRLTNS